MAGEDGGRGEAAGKEDGPSFSEIESTFVVAVNDYKKNSQRFQWKDQALAYYRDYFSDTEKEEFLKVPASDLDYFCRSHLRSSSLRNILADGLLFFKLHSSWEVSICPSPDCLSFFTQHHSLIPHLMCHHLNVHPFLQHNPDEEQWCAKTFAGTVWKPIDVERVLNMLSTTSLDARHFGSLEWPLSEDFSRGQLLTELQRGVEFLIGFQESKMLSSSCLRVLTVVASDYILQYLDPGCAMPLPFRSLFYCSALPFRFMENESLSCFVELVRDIRKLVQDEASQIRDLEGSKEGDVSWSKSEYLDAVSIQDGCDYFVLDTAKLKLCDGDKEGIALWLYEAPMLPAIPQVPSRLSEILKLLESKTTSFSEHLTTFGAERDFRSAELVSWFKLCSTTTRLPIHGTTYVELASNGELHAANSDQMLHPSSHSAADSTKRRRIESAFVMMQQHLKLIKLTCELQLLELRVRRVCAVDLRMYILPLLRSFLRMKLYVFLCMGWDPGFVEEDAPSVHLIEESRADHTEDHAPSEFKGEPGAENDRDMATPYIDTCKRIEESSSTPLEFGSSGSIANSLSEPDNMMIDGQAPGGKPLGTTGGAHSDIITSQVSSAAAALSDKRAGIATASFGSEAEPEAVHVSDSVNEGKAEIESWRQQQVGEDLFGCPNMAAPSLDTTSESGDYPDFERRSQESMNLISSELDWYETERKTWETKDDGIFFRIGITDVVKHFLECSQRPAAQSIWRWKTNRAQQYWYCFTCEESFLDQASHTVHMESEHELGLSCDFYCLVPSQVWQKDLNGDVKEKTHTLDDFFEVDHTHGTFLVNMTKIGISYQNEEQEQLSVSRHSLFAKKVEAIRYQVSELDTAIVQNFTQLIKLKQELSELCVFDYKNEISSSIRSFVPDKILVDISEFESWACKTLKDLFGYVRCLYLPDSFSTVLESTGKVVVNLQERYSSVGFAYAGLRWRFGGDLSFEGTRKIKGSYIHDGMLYGGPKFAISYHDKLIVDGIKRTGLFGICAKCDFQWEVHEKFQMFQDEFKRRLRGELVRPRAIIVELHRFFNGPQ